MRKVSLSVGFVPLIDCAPLLVAADLGFAEEEGLELNLRRAPSWSAVRDMLSYGQVDAAHMLSPVPVAMALGLGGGGVAMEAVSVLSINGEVVGISLSLARRMRAAGHDFDFADAGAAGRALIDAAPRPLRIGVPFPFSMHAELVYYWLSALGLPAPQSLVVRTVPPPLMADALKAGEIDAFCVGEPWASKAVEAGAGALLLPGSAIWSFAPEKVLALRADWDEPELRGRLVRAVWRAGRWLADPASFTLATELLSRPAYLGIAPEIIDRAISGRLVITSDGDTRKVDRFVIFHESAAQFPWRSQAGWIGSQLAARTGLDRAEAVRKAGQAFRSDLFRTALAPTSADLPSASSRIEGAPRADSLAATVRGEMTIFRNAFFDERQFDFPFVKR